MQVVRIVSELPEPADGAYVVIRKETKTRKPKADAEAPKGTKGKKGAKKVEEETYEALITEYYLDGKKKYMPRKEPLHFVTDEACPELPSLTTRQTFLKDLHHLSKLPMVEGSVVEFSNFAYTWANKAFYLSDRPGKVLAFTVYGESVARSEDEEGGEDESEDADDEEESSTDFVPGEEYTTDQVKAAANISGVKNGYYLTMPKVGIFHRLQTNKWMCISPEEFNTMNVCWVMSTSSSLYVKVSESEEPQKKINSSQKLKKLSNKLLQKMRGSDRCALFAGKSFLMLRKQNNELVRSEFSIIVPPKLPGFYKIEVDEETFNEYRQELSLDAESFEADLPEGSILQIQAEESSNNALFVFANGFYHRLENSS